MRATGFFTLLMIAHLATAANVHCQDRLSEQQLSELRSEALEGMRRAANFFRTEVASHGGYVYFYDVDLKKRWGEGEATPDQIWVEPPGTPAVGLAYVAAYEATADRSYLIGIEEVAEALIHGQLESGGWMNCIDFDPWGARVARYRHGNGRGRNNSSLDDGQTQTAIEFMVRADRALEFKNQRVHEAAQFALQTLLQAQFPCGAFPQSWTGPVAPHAPRAASFPDYDWRSEGRIKNYWDLYTLNDNLAVTTTQALLEAYQVYQQPEYLAAVERLGDFLILAQMPEPQPAWAQQYNYEMQPVWARKFEPPAICGHESQAIVPVLMDIYLATGNEKYLAPIEPALNYLRRSELPGGYLARYYELRTNRPLYMEREGEIYRLTYQDDNLPAHYSWKTRSKVDQLQQAYAQVRDRLAKPAKSADAQGLARKARSVLASLDEQGRWLSRATGQRVVGQAKFEAGQEVISSAVFNDNLRTLAEFVAATAPDR